MEIQYQSNPQLEGLGRLLASIEGFNDHYSTASQMTKTMGVLFSVIFRDADAPEKRVEPPSPAPLTVAEKIFEKHRAVVNSLGLEISLNRDASEARSLQHEYADQFPPEDKHGIEISTHRIDLSVLDEAKLLAFFQTLKLADVRDEKAQATLSTVAQQLDAAVVHAYMMQYLERDDGQAASLFEAAGEISSEYHRLGLKDSAATLLQHLQHVWQGDLKELLIAESHHILPAEGFQPHNWHEDPADYQGRWNRALAALRVVAENPRAEAIFNESKDYLSVSLGLAQQHFRGLEKNEEASPYYRELAPGHLKLIGELAGELEDIRMSAE